MAKASPMVRSFNAGEFSDLLEGRVDLERYPASLRSLFNYIAAPQGPAICRSGTVFSVPANADNEYSNLIPFVFSNEQAKLLEFASDRIRFIDEDGLQVYPFVDMTMASASNNLIKFVSADLNAAIGDQIVLEGFPFQYNLNGEIVKITAKTGTTYTTNRVFPGLPVVNGQVARVYHVSCVYTEAQRRAIRVIQSVDVLYLLAGNRPRKLSRYGTYDWRLADIEFVDGPYMPVNDTSTVLTPSATGNAIPDMTSDTLPSGEASGSGAAPATVIADEEAGELRYAHRIYYPLPASAFYYAFDASDDTWWGADGAQKGIIEYTPDTPFVCDGYTIYAALDNQDPDFIAKDYAPGTFTFEGYDGTNWIVLDQQDNYVLYEANKSVFFKLTNETSYEAYRLNIMKCTRNGPIEPRVRRLVMRSTTSASIHLVASAVTNINNDQGFLSTDVGRLIRIKGTDNSWRSCKITAVNSPTDVTVQLLGEPLLNLKSIRDWRLGYWSDTTGWPIVGDFFEDRLWLMSPEGFPDQFAASVTGDYETMSQTDTFGAVLDDSAIVGRLNSRKLSRIQWISSDERGLLLGTGSEEYVMAAPNKEAITARNIKARPTTRRGSAAVEPVRVDSQVLFVQRSGRTIREFAYVFEADGYKSPSMSQLASHLGALQFVEMDYAAEPHSIVWIRRADGSLVGLTYNRDENVVGWHRHDLSGGLIDTIAVLPQKDQLQDALWMMVIRQVNGKSKRYIERLTRFWDFDTTLDQAHYVDCGLRYEGTPIAEVYGLQHLEKEEVYGLADNKPVGPLTVIDGHITLPFEASNIVIGLGYESLAETSRLENGAADGTAQGKVKRMHNISAGLWRSAGGEIGRYNDEVKGPVYEPIEYPGDLDVIEDVSLFTGIVGPYTPTPGYEKRATLFFRRPKDSPLPFNVTALMPQMDTQDR